MCKNPNEVSDCVAVLTFKWKVLAIIDFGGYLTFNAASCDFVFKTGHYYFSTTF